MDYSVTRSFFTHYWSESTLDYSSEGSPFNHTAGNLFARSGVTTGDRVYGVSVIKGTPVLIGGMTVGRPPIGHKEASDLLPYKPWKAEEHLIAANGTESTTSYRRIIPIEILRRLRFMSPAGESALKFVSEIRLDQQTLRGVRKLTSSSADLLENLLRDVASLHNQDEQRLPTRREILINRLQRDRVVVAHLKRFHNDCCQLCGKVIELPGGGRYSEGHHLRPLGAEHQGEDRLENLICVCPNCHTMLDYGCMPLELSSLRLVAAHQIDARNIAYHNEQIYGQPIVG